MPGSANAEVIFIGAMMVLILVISFASVYFFFRTYRREMGTKSKPVVQTLQEKTAVDPTNGSDDT